MGPILSPILGLDPKLDPKLDHGSSNIGTVRALFLRVRKGALINIHTNEGA